jgi:hypothetical protein
VRLLKDNQFWVTMPEHKIDIKDTDIVALKQQTVEALKQVSPITWEDVLVIKVTSDKDDFPKVSYDTKQNGVDTDGTKYHRDGPGRSPYKDHMSSGNDYDAWHQESGFRIVLPDTKENRAFMKSLTDGAGDVICQMARVFGMTHRRENEKWRFGADPKKVAKAIAQVKKRGIRLTADLGRRK